MEKAKRLVDVLVLRYGGKIDAEQVCEDEGIKVIYCDCLEGAGGVYMRSGEEKIIIVPFTVSKSSCRFFIFHELWYTIYCYSKFS